jgi:hypothetical protein
MRTIRPIAISNIPETFRVRTATDENRLTLAQLTALGITESRVSEKLHGSYEAWLSEVQGSVVGFATGDRSSGEMWVIAVPPGHIGRGIGESGSLAFQRGLLGVVAKDRGRHSIARYSFYEARLD